MPCYDLQTYATKIYIEIMQIYSLINKGTYSTVDILFPLGHSYVTHYTMFWKEYMLVLSLHYKHKW